MGVEEGEEEEEDGEGIEGEGKHCGGRRMWMGWEVEGGGCEEITMELKAMLLQNKSLTYTIH